MVTGLTIVGVLGDGSWMMDVCVVVEMMSVC